MRQAVVTGASSGLGKLIEQSLLDQGWATYNWSKDTGVDVTDKVSVAQAAWRIFPSYIDALVNCAGVNEINFLPDIEEGEWDRVMNTNAKGIYLCSQALLAQLRGGTIVNIVSNASHVPMTSSLVYNASKGAAAIMTKQMNRELKKTHDITVFAVSPNKMSGTRMSAYIDQRVCELRGWSMDQASAYQLAALPAGKETDPAVVAEFITFLLSKKERHKYLAGCDIPYGA